MTRSTRLKSKTDRGALGWRLGDPSSHMGGQWEQQVPKKATSLHGSKLTGIPSTGLGQQRRTPA